MWNRFKTLDPWLFAIPVMLMVVSVVVIFALTVDNIGRDLYLRQSIFGLMAILLMLALTFIDYRSLKAWWLWLYSLTVGGLLAVDMIGKTEFGAQSWIELGFFRLQPGEVAKATVIIALAAILSRHQTISFSRYIGALVVVVIPFLMVLSQPDFGTSIVIIGLAVGVLLSANLRRYQRWFILLSIAILATTLILSFRSVEPFTAILKPYQKDRLASFIDPERDKSGTGYNVLQSVIAVGSGGLTGKGLGLGSQSQLNFLPVPHADFIFAVIAEAWGFVGSVGIIGLLSYLLIRIMKAASIAKDQFGLLLCIGIFFKLLIEVMVNIGMNIQVMPVTGIPLPFLSYGGTTMITNAICIGVVQSVVIRYKRLTF